MNPLDLSRGAFDIGLLTNKGDEMLSFWRDEIGLEVERTLRPVPGVTQHKLTLRGAVLKVNSVERDLPRRARLGGLRTLLLADPGVTGPQHLRDPDGNQVCLLPTGFAEIGSFGMHLAVSDERAYHHFFAAVLGLSAVGESAYDFAGATLSFAWSPDAAPGLEEAGVGFSYLTFQVMDARVAHSTVCGRGAVEDRPPSGEYTSTDSIISFIRDPDGNRIEISQRPDLVAAALPRPLKGR